MTFIIPVSILILLLLLPLFTAVTAAAPDHVSGATQHVTPQCLLKYNCSEVTTQANTVPPVSSSSAPAPHLRQSSSSSIAKTITTAAAAAATASTTTVATPINGGGDDDKTKCSVTSGAGFMKSFTADCKFAGLIVIAIGILILSGCFVCCMWCCCRKTLKKCCCPCCIRAHAAPVQAAAAPAAVAEAAAAAAVAAVEMARRHSHSHSRPNHRSHSRSHSHSHHHNPRGDAMIQIQQQNVTILEMMRRLEQQHRAQSPAGVVVNNNHYAAMPNGIPALWSPVAVQPRGRAVTPVVPVPAPVPAPVVADNDETVMYEGVLVQLPVLPNMVSPVKVRASFSGVEEGM